MSIFVGIPPEILVGAGVKESFKRKAVLHPTKEGQFPRDPIFFGQTPVFLEGPWSGDSKTVGEIEKGVRIFLREPFSQ